MDIITWYNTNFEHQLSGRYITLNDINPIIESYGNKIEIIEIGKSELEKDIHLLRIGSGKKNVLAWSQMHGNESTTTKAIFDFLKFLTQLDNFQEEINRFKDEYSLYVIPMLNPDGAERYTRVNANEVDLNRDAKNLSQSESRFLNTVFTSIQPYLCLNLHDQRTNYGLDNTLPATVSFLSPSANEKRDLTASRKTAMNYIVKMNAFLQQIIPNQVGRYDDSFNDNCVGDKFQMAEVPTILFEAGHYKRDYMRDITRKFIFGALISLFDIQANASTNWGTGDYFKIPENRINYKDIILNNVKHPKYKKPIKVSIQYEEELSGDTIVFIPVVNDINVPDKIFAHNIIDLKGEEVLINSQQNIYIGQKISEITNKNGDLIDIFLKS
jgi:hypothetical protein